MVIGSAPRSTRRVPSRLSRASRSAHLDLFGTAWESPTTLNLLADPGIIVLRASRLVGAYVEARDLLRGKWRHAAQRHALVTGPSRSADFEQCWNSARFVRASCTWC